MKKILLLLIFTSSFSFSQKRDGITYLTKEQIEKIKKANVDFLENEKGEGLFVFIGCKPVEPYTIIADIKTLTIDSRKHNDQKKYLFFEAIEKYPKANGIIINTTKDRWTAEVIIFDEIK